VSDTLTSYAALLKTTYPDERIADMIFNKNRFLDMVEKDEDFFGNAYPHAMIYGGPAAAVNANFAKAQAGAAAGSTLGAQFNINSRGTVFGLARWSREVMLASQPNEGAFMAAGPP
jgi:hypothetical protein